MMIECPKCKADIEKDSWFCDQCGQELKVCPKCGNFGKGNRCTQCGTKLVTAKEKAEGVGELEGNSQSPTPQSVQQPAQQPSSDSTLRPSTDAPQTTKGMNLFCPALQVNISTEENAVVGRKNGQYTHVFGSQGYVSGTHAKFVIANGHWAVVDLDSTNGTFFNGKKLTPNVPCPLTIGGKLKFANIEFIVGVNS